MTFNSSTLSSFSVFCFSQNITLDNEACYLCAFIAQSNNRLVWRQKVGEYISKPIYPDMLVLFL